MVEAAQPPVEMVLPGTRLAARIHGPPAGRPVLALHGWLDNAASFDALAPLLPGLRIAAVDLPGHGLSAHRGADAGYAFVDWICEVFRMADALGWERFAVLGHSLGAAIASMAAGTIPARFTALALIEGLAPITAAAAEAPKRLAEYLTEARAPRRPSPVYPSEAEALAARVGAGQFAVPDAMLGVVRRGISAVPGGVKWRADPRLKLPSAMRYTPELAGAFLERIECPVLLVKATKGLAAPGSALAAQQDLQASKVKHLETVEVEGFHHVHLDAPATVAAAVNRFFRGAGANV